MKVGKLGVIRQGHCQPFGMILPRLRIIVHIFLFECLKIIVHFLYLVKLENVTKEYSILVVENESAPTFLKLCDFSLIDDNFETDGVYRLIIEGVLK